MNTAKVYDVRKDNESFSLTASIRQQGLYLDGFDYCALAGEMFGNMEHDYCIRFDEENTLRLQSALGVEDVIQGVVDFFGGELKNNEFLAFCAANHVEYHYFSI